MSEANVVEYTDRYGEKYSFKEVDTSRWHYDYQCEDGKYRILYGILNTVNGKWYIGQHITSNLNDGYLGSGVKIKKAIAKYGKEKFKKFIFYHFENQEDLDQAEQWYILGFNAINNKLGYNLKLSSKGGLLTDEVKNKISKSRFKYLETAEKKSWNQGLKGYESEETKNKRISKLKGKERPLVMEKVWKTKRENDKLKLELGLPINSRCKRIKVTDTLTNEFVFYNSSKDYQRNVSKVHVINYIRSGKLLNKRYKFEHA